MTKDIEREAFEEWIKSNYPISKLELLEKHSDGGYQHRATRNMFDAWQAAKAHQAEKLKGCVVVPESEYNEIAQYKDLYKRAIVNARKRKNQINWAHVAGLGVGSGRAVELCKELKIDPHATDMNVILEAARGGNE